MLIKYLETLVLKQKTDPLAKAIIIKIKEMKKS